MERIIQEFRCLYCGRRYTSRYIPGNINHPDTWEPDCGCGSVECEPWDAWLESAKSFAGNRDWGDSEWEAYSLLTAGCCDLSDASGRRAFWDIACQMKDQPDVVMEALEFWLE